MQWLFDLCCLRRPADIEMTVFPEQTQNGRKRSKSEDPVMTLHHDLQFCPEKQTAIKRPCSLPARRKQNLFISVEHSPRLVDPAVHVMGQRNFTIEYNGGETDNIFINQAATNIGLDISHRRHE